MLTFLFWNVCGPGIVSGDARYLRLQSLLQEVVRSHQVQILILAESPFEGTLTVPGFVEMPTLTPKNPLTDCRLEIYADASVQMSPLGAVGRGTVQEVTLPHKGGSFLLGAVHLNSGVSDRNEIDKRERQGRAIEFADEIMQIENRNSGQSALRQTIVVGDFNYEPYDLPLVYSKGFNAVAGKEQARQKVRTMKPIARPYFYNPMWGRFGDAVSGPSGTYCYKGDWRMPDQVLLRPDILAYWSDNDMMILSSIGNTNLLNQNGMPMSKRVRAVISDHLPIVFSLNF